MSMDHLTHLPCEIECILNTGIHTLTASRAVNMRGIARKKNSTKPELVDLAMGDMETRKPNSVPQLYVLASPPIYKRLHFRQLRFALFAIFFPLPYRSNYTATFRSKWKN